LIDARAVRWRNQEHPDPRAGRMFNIASMSRSDPNCAVAVVHSPKTSPTLDKRVAPQDRVRHGSGATMHAIPTKPRRRMSMATPSCMTIRAS
jgi:hypothetical protein